jgi:hypothetical protein
MSSQLGCLTDLGAAGADVFTIQMLAGARIGEYLAKIRASGSGNNGKSNG